MKIELPKAVTRVWNAGRREIDIRILWPSIREQAKSIEDAREAYRLHMLLDDAYSDMTVDDCEEFVNNLPE